MKKWILTGRRAKKAAAILVCAGLGIIGPGVWKDQAPIIAMAAQSDDPSRFVEGTVINGVGVSGMTVEEAKSQIESFYNGSYTLRIHDREDKQEILHDTDIGYRLEVTGGLQEVLDQENAGGRMNGPGINNFYSAEVNAAYDEESLNRELERLAVIMGSRHTRDAHISAYEEGKPFVIVPEVYGNEFDMDVLTSVVKDALNTQKKDLDLTDSGAYKTVKITSENEELASLCAAMNQMLEVSITYTFGDSQEILPGSQIASWVQGTSGTTILVDEAQAADYVKTLADQYDTYGKPHSFHTTAGYDVTVSGPYGWQMDQVEETKALISMIQTCETQSREPVYKKKGASRSGNDYGTTYVELDLTAQHLYLYENGALIIDSPFVSGNVSKGWTTPEGIYPLTYKERDRVLRGAKLPDGSYEYESPVSYWMPFNGGIGLHDANWRGSFGGDIYKTNGSHGCVNLPPKVAPVVYEHVYTGIPVICHNKPAE